MSSICVGLMGEWSKFRQQKVMHGKTGHREALSANTARTVVRGSAYLEMGALSPVRGMLDLQKTD